MRRGRFLVTSFNHPADNLKMKKDTIRRSKEIIFWRDHYVTIVKIDGKIRYIGGKKFPKTAQEIVEKVK
jgi:hypothetical protein